MQPTSSGSPTCPSGSYFAVDGKLRGCDLVKIKIGTLAIGPLSRSDDQHCVLQMIGLKSFDCVLVSLHTLSEIHQ